MSYDLCLYDIGTRTSVKIELFNRNIYSNVRPLFEVTGVLEVLKETPPLYAEGLTYILETAICKLSTGENVFMRLIADKGGSSLSSSEIYDSAIKFLRETLHMCRQYPSAFVQFSS